MPTTLRDRGIRPYRHHSAALTLATYVHLVDGDIGEPLSIPQGGTGVVTDPTPLDSTSDVPMAA